MNVTQLTLVEPAREDAGEKVQRLYADGRIAAMEHMTLLETVLRAEVKLAREISGGGDLYPVGVRELCRRQAHDAALRLENLRLLMDRAAG